MTIIRRLFPKPVACHGCRIEYAGIKCPRCKEERPLWAALKNITARERAAQPLSFPLPACRYYPPSICDCGQRGLCVPAA